MYLRFLIHFMSDESGENQQLAQLQILYKARGRKIEELKNELEVVKAESGREIRILKHQLSVAKGLLSSVLYMFCVCMHEL